MVRYPNLLPVEPSELAKPSSSRSDADVGQRQCTAPADIHRADELRGSYIGLG